MNILHDSICPGCHRQATLELKADAATHDPQQLDAIVFCHACCLSFNMFICIDEMVVCGE